MTSDGNVALDAPQLADHARLKRWRQHLHERQVTVPDEADFRAYGRLSTLERLLRVLAIEAPDDCGPLGRVIADLKVQKRRRNGSKARGGERGPVRRHSIARDDLRPDWRATLDEMRMARLALNDGLILAGEATPPALSQIRSMEYVLRNLSQTCLEGGQDPAISRETVRCWLDAAQARGCRETGLSHQLRKIEEFLRYRGESRKLAKKIRKQAARLVRQGRLRRKCKYDWILRNPTDIGQVWDLAEKLLAQSRAAKPGSARRYRLALHAAALALAIAVPLRIGDLHRLRIGIEIARDATGWAVEIITAKTRGEYERPSLWPELTPFLDELLVLEAPGGDLWSSYERRSGTPLFSRDGGRTALSADWISDVWYEHVGTGEHIVRTLWHQAVVNGADDRTWLALALCGQRSLRTADEYRERGASRRSVQAGRQILMASRQSARMEAILLQGAK